MKTVLCHMKKCCQMKKTAMLLSASLAMTFLTPCAHGNIVNIVPGIAATPVEKARQVVSTVVNGMTAVLKNKGLSRDQKEGQVRKLIKENFRIPSIVQFIFGRAYRGLSQEDRKRAARAYLSYLATSYTDKLMDSASSVGSDTVRITKTHVQDESGQILVTTEATVAGMEKPVAVIWYLYQIDDKKTGGKVARIYDVSVEGLSESLSHQQEFQPIIAPVGTGVNAFIAEIEKRIAKIHATAHQ